MKFQSKYASLDLDFAKPNGRSINFDSVICKKCLMSALVKGVCLFCERETQVIKRKGFELNLHWRWRKTKFNWNAVCFCTALVVTVLVFVLYSI